MKVATPKVPYHASVTSPLASVGAEPLHDQELPRVIVAVPASATTVIHALLADPLLTVSVPPLARLIERAELSDTVVAATTVSVVVIVPASPVPGMS